MLELIMRPSITLPYYPDSGPGTKFLREGDTSLGFFGTVSESEIGVFSQVLDKAGVDPSSRLFDPAKQNNWLKFFHKGKVIYIPTFPMARVTYQSIENAKMSYDFLKGGTPDNPDILLTGTPMWKLGPLFEAADGNTVYPRLLDMKSDASSVTDGESIASGSEFYDLIMSVFFPAMSNPQNVRLSPSYLESFYTGYDSTTPMCELVSSSLCGASPLDGTNANAGKVVARAVSGVAVNWFCVLQLVKGEDLAKVPLELKNIESWTNEVNSRPSLWADADSLMPPFNFRAPFNQSIINPTVIADGPLGIIQKQPHSDKFSTDTRAIMAPVGPLLISAATTDFLKPTNAALPTTSGKRRWIRKSRHFPDTPQIQGAFYAMSESTFMVYSGMGKSGNMQVTYSGSVFTYNTATKTRGTAQSPGTWTWNSGLQIGNDVYLCDGHWDSQAQGGGLRKFSITNPAQSAVILARADNGGNSARKTSVLCAIGTTKIVRFGGWNYSNASIANSGSIYDIASNTWSYIQNAPEGRLWASAYHYNGKIYFIGGETVGGMAKKIMVYTIASNTWALLDVPMPMVYAYSEGQFYNGKVIIPVTFQDSLQSIGFLVIDPETLAMDQVYTSEPFRRMHSGRIIGDEIFVGGGTGAMNPSDWDNNPPACGVITFKLSDLVP